MRLAPFQKPLAASVAVIVVVPAPTIVTRPEVELIVAAEVLLLLYVTAPGLFDDVGAVTVNGASSARYPEPGNANPLNCGVPLLTLMVFVTATGALKTPHAVCVAVMVNEPEPTMLTRPVLASIVATDVLLLVYVMTPLLVKLPPISFMPELDVLTLKSAAP